MQTFTHAKDVRKRSIENVMRIMNNDIISASDNGCFNVSIPKIKDAPTLQYVLKQLELQNFTVNTDGSHIKISWPA